MKWLKIVVEKHPDTYVAYPLGVKGAIPGYSWDIIRQLRRGMLLTRDWRRHGTGSARRSG